MYEVQYKSTTMERWDSSVQLFVSQEQAEKRAKYLFERGAHAVKVVDLETGEAVYERSKR